MNWFRNTFGRRERAAPAEAGPQVPPPPPQDAGLFAVAEGLNAEADRLMAEGKPAEALPAISAAAASVLATVGSRTDLPGPERWLAELQGKEASVKVRLGDLDGAAQSLLDSLMTYRGLSDRFPIDPDLKAEVGIALQKIARVLMLQGRHGDALTFIQDASQIFAGLAAEWTGEERFRQFFAACTDLMAECFTALGKPDLAAELKRRAG
jgi:tetratricopeptide (TPR) repeat protein